MAPIFNPLNKQELAALPALFSTRILRELASNEHPTGFVRLAEQSGLLKRLNCQMPVGEFFNQAFSFLKRKGSRNEYVYKAALTQKLLLGRHSLQTAALLTEFRVGDCKADVVILNGTSSVYEIKSERDSLDRLPKQLEAYTSVFSRVNVIACKRHLERVLELVPASVGVLSLSDRYQISTIQDAADSASQTSTLAIFEALRTEEAKLVLARLGIKYPDVPNTRMRNSLRGIFNELPSQEAHDAMVYVLRSTRNSNYLGKYLEHLPVSLHPLAIGTKLRRRDFDRLLLTMQKPMNLLKVTR